MGDLIKFNKPICPVSDLVERLVILNDKNNLKGLAAVYITDNGEVNFLHSTPENTLKIMGGLDVLKLDMIERDIVRDDI